MLPFQSNGSLVTLDGKVVGSKLMSQEFESDMKLLHSRPMAESTSTVDQLITPALASKIKTLPWQRYLTIKSPVVFLSNFLISSVVKSLSYGAESTVSVRGLACESIFLISASKSASEVAFDGQYSSTALFLLSTNPFEST